MGCKTPGKWRGERSWSYSLFKYWRG